MPLQRYARSLGRTAAAVTAFLFFAGCAKNPVRVDTNRPPRTYIVAAPGSALARDTTNASYRIHLYWRGEDPDGYVSSYLWAFDDSSVSNFRYTTKTDSVFEVTVNDSADIVGGSTRLTTAKIHTFFVRAVDNLGKADPNLAVWNRRLYRAGTDAPIVQFVDSLPSGRGIDTLSDGQPFRICWTGQDPDGQVVRYKYDIGTYSSPLITDSCAFFNDALVPGSVALSSNLYTMTVTAVDNAYAVGQERFFLIVNHDPETWFVPKGTLKGHYIQPFLYGNKVDSAGTFGEGDTIPYRSTVWFEWDGEDVKGGESNCLNGFSLILRGGTRNESEPYVTGFQNFLGGTRFTTNDPAVLGPLGYRSFILDSLDAGYNMIMLVAARDCSNRADGTPAAFQFNCNRRPTIDTLYAETGQFDNSQVEGVLISWHSTDFEDREAIRAKVKLDGLKTVEAGKGDQFIFISNDTFRSLQQGDIHSAEVRVLDRANFESDNSLTVFFDITTPAPSSQSTRRQ